MRPRAVFVGDVLHSLPEKLCLERLNWRRGEEKTLSIYLSNFIKKIWKKTRRVVEEEEEEKAPRGRKKTTTEKTERERVREIDR